MSSYNVVLQRQKDGSCLWAVKKGKKVIAVSSDRSDAYLIADALNGLSHLEKEYTMLSERKKSSTLSSFGSNFDVV